MEYRFTEIEEKCKQFWAEAQVYKVTEDASKPKFYVLDMFPYPSGAGLHVGHPLGYVASDIYARYKRLKGYNVLHPMGYDAFGLPAEQYAIETGTHPETTTKAAIKRYREQLDKIGFSFDWSRQVTTCEPDYYKWTQWIFLKLYNSWYNREANKAEHIDTLIAKFLNTNSKFQTNTGEKPWSELTEAERQQVLMSYRLVYLSFAEVNWCEALGCVLANDEVKDGKSERGGYPVEKRKMRQWFLRITEYSDRLLQGLETLDWSEAMKEMQRNWIGRSEGASIKFKVEGGELEVFTTRPDTIYGATFMVIAPEHELVEQLTTPAQKAAIDKYVAYVKSRSDVERQQEKKVTGEFTGSYAINPFTGTQIPIYIAEYVLAGYGTGAIMAVPADDERDRKFAEKFGLPVTEIIDKSMYPGATIEDKVGKMINSDFLNGMEVKDAIAAVLNEVESRGIGKRKVNYKQRDAIYSRQRYWGEPIPMRYGVMGEPDTPFGESNDIPYPVLDPLPLQLPEVTSFKPTGDGRSPLANNADWVKKGYETDTMPGYAGSSWYFLRYMDANNPNEFAAKDKLDYWQNVDVYFGGAEHAVGHLLYSRMWHKVLYDLGYVPTDEPFKKLVNQGMIQGRSSFVYVLHFKFLDGKTYNNDKFLLPEVIVSKDIRERIRENINTDIIGNELKKLFKEVQDICNANELDLQVDENNFLIMQGRVNIDFVQNDILDIAAFSSNKLGSKNLRYLYSPGTNKIICHDEVEKMSKSKYNVVNPDDVIAKYGADCFRMFEMFLGPIEQSKPWDDKGISGVSNFLKKFWRLFYHEDKWLVNDDQPTDAEFKVLHKTLKKLEDDIERLNFNTCISGFMIATNELTSLKCNKRAILQPLVIAIAPFAPFVAEELLALIENNGQQRTPEELKRDGFVTVHKRPFPKVEQKYLVESSHKYPISINGKVRAEIELALDLEQAEVEAQVLALDAVQKHTNGNAPKKFIYVKGRIINVVV